MDRNQENLNLATLIENGASHAEAQADTQAEQIEITPEGAHKTRGVIGSFIRSYKGKSPDLFNKAWLCLEFAKYPDVWSNEKELKHTADEIVEEVEIFGTCSRGYNQTLFD